MRSHFCSAVVLSAAFFVSAPCISYAADDQDTVINHGGSIVVSTHGGCVRSKWQAGSDACGAAAPEVPETPVAKAAPSLQPDRDQRTVYFEFNQSALTLEAAQKLDALVRWIARARGVTSATVVGFADQIGDANANQRLSEARAQNVRSYLRNKGVTLPTNVEVVKGMGEGGSVTRCDPQLPRDQKIACLAPDRRVEVKFEIVR